MNPTPQTNTAQTENVQITMTRPTLDALPPLPPLPAGIVFRPMHGASEANEWTSIQQDAEPFIPIADDLFVREFGTDNAPISARCFFAVDAETGKPVGVASAWHGGDAGARGENGEDWGRLHWVAVRPDYQRRSIARYLVIRCLYEMADLKHKRAYLVTSTGRTGAIALYQSVGFVIDPLI